MIGLARIAAAIAVAVATCTTQAASRPINAKLLELPRDRWVEIHRQQPGDAVFFRRQPHGGSAFDSKRGRIVLFGSDTHGHDWTNSPLYFDVASLTWSRAYADDDPATYRVTENGIPIAGTGDPHPWAMHTFAAVTYDVLNDRLVVASYPKHLEPGRFTDALAHVWPKVRRHPTWFFDFETQRWHALESTAEDFFPYATAYDSHRAVVVGYRADGIYELPMNQPRPKWREVASASHQGYHTNAVYDSKRRRVVVAGSHEWSNDIVIYDPAKRRDRIMPTSGRRPSKFQHAPMAFHERKGVIVVLIDRFPETGEERSFSETWLYDPDADGWSPVEGATLPFTCGMNFNMHYDPLHDLLLLVADTPGLSSDRSRPTGEGIPTVTSVWALELR